jgi:uncharacterized membrane protein YeiH
MSGALTAMNKKWILWECYHRFCKAVGGGTLRDILIGGERCGWMLDLTYVYVIIIGFVLAIIFRKKFDTLRTSLFYLIPLVVYLL